MRVPSVGQAIPAMLDGRLEALPGAGVAVFPGRAQLGLDLVPLPVREARIAAHRAAVAIGRRDVVIDAAIVVEGTEVAAEAVFLGRGQGGPVHDAVLRERLPTLAGGKFRSRGDRPQSPRAREILQERPNRLSNLPSQNPSPRPRPPSS